MPSFSRSFKSKDSVNWKSKLREVHTHAWNAWKTHLASKPLYRLSDSSVQNPGDIPDVTMEELSSIVSELPSKAKYSRKT